MIILPDSILATELREAFDELWIIDLEGDNLGARKTENVFNILSPVAIAIGVRYDRPNPETVATVRYTRISGTREEKFAKLNAIKSLADLQWQDCFDGWMQPFLLRGRGDYFTWPLLTDLFPWQHSGVQFKRTWPIAATAEVLRQRWRALLAKPANRRGPLLRETPARRANKEYRSFLPPETISRRSVGFPGMLHRLSPFAMVSAALIGNGLCQTQDSATDRGRLSGGPMVPIKFISLVW